MIRTLIHLECDSCRELSLGFDGAIYTAARMRRDLKEIGWVRRFLGTRIHRDLCPRCAKKAGRK